MGHVLNAAGVPTMMPFAPLNSFARLTLFPGEPSTRTSRSGRGSPALTKAARVLWKSARCALARGRAVVRRLAANMVNVLERKDRQKVGIDGTTIAINDWRHSERGWGVECREGAARRRWCSSRRPRVELRRLFRHTVGARYPITLREARWKKAPMAPCRNTGPRHMLLFLLK